MSMRPTSRLRTERQPLIRRRSSGSPRGPTPQFHRRTPPAITESIRSAEWRAYVAEHGGIERDDQQAGARCKRTHPLVQTARRPARFQAEPLRPDPLGPIRVQPDTVGSANRLQPSPGSVPPGQFQPEPLRPDPRAANRAAPGSANRLQPSPPGAVPPPPPVTAGPPQSGRIAGNGQPPTSSPRRRTKCPRRRPPGTDRSLPGAHLLRHKSAPDRVTSPPTRTASSQHRQPTDMPARRRQPLPSSILRSPTGAPRSPIPRVEAPCLAAPYTAQPPVNPTMAVPVVATEAAPHEPESPPPPSRPSGQILPWIVAVIVVIVVVGIIRLTSSQSPDSLTPTTGTSTTVGATAAPRLPRAPGAPPRRHI